MALAVVAPDKKRAVVIALNCETDFVAKNDDFTSTTKSILDLAVEKNPDSLDELLALDLNGMTVAEVIVETTGRTGEKVELSAYTVVSGETVVAYNHPKKIQQSS
jgi:elongation factor Ts